MARNADAPLGAGSAVDRCAALDAECEARIAEKSDAIRIDFAERKAKIRERVPADQRAHFDAMIAARLAAAEPEPNGDGSHIPPEI